MVNYSNSEKSRARGLMIGVVLLIITVVVLYTSIKHHDKGTAASGLVLGLVTILGLYSAMT